MCPIVDVVYHYSGFCGNTLDRIDSCPDEAFAGLCEDVCLHISDRITEEESLDMFCPTCFHISELRGTYQAGKLTLERMEKMITDMYIAPSEIHRRHPTVWPIMPRLIRYLITHGAQGQDRRRPLRSVIR